MPFLFILIKQIGLNSDYLIKRSVRWRMANLRISKMMRPPRAMRMVVRRPF